MSPLVRALPPSLTLLTGSHETADAGLCVMEAVAFVAGEAHTDTPACACPVMSAFLRGWNDGLRTDEERTRLLTPLIARLVDSKSTAAVEQHRADLALDWFVRVQTPAWLSLVPTLMPHAAALRALAPLVTAEAILAAQSALIAARTDSAAERDAAGAAARDAAGAAARAAAWAAARDAAGAAARAAAGAAAWNAAWNAAWAAARDAAGAAARAAARDAAGDAAGDALQPTIAQLQREALVLIDQMLAVTPESLREANAIRSQP